MKPKLPAGNPATLLKSTNPNAMSTAPKKPVSRKQVAAIAFKTQGKGKANIRGLNTFMHGKNAGKSMILSQ